jgi:polysaccharide export outer membrane protein
MKELAQITVRVSAEGEISLPFIGVVKVNGLTEKKLSEELLRRLGENYMHNPQVNLYVREYRSRRVAILGAVANPGLYSLTKGTETLLDVISLAGGMTKEAAARIHLIPFEPVENGKPKENISDALAEFVSKGSSPDILKGVDPIVIDLQSLINGGDQMYLGLPVRPGDVIVVPGSGEVLIDGWVEKPGSYKITPGLTVIGAVAAAGGVAFAADISSVKIIRTGRQGQKILVLADLEAINHGDKPDIPVQEGDVIKVPSSAPRLVGYGIYRFFSTAIHIGASVPLIK